MSLPTVVRELVSLIRRHSLTYALFNKYCHLARKQIGMKPGKGARKLPKLLTEEQITAFYTAIDNVGNLQHQLILRLLFYTGIRVAELCAIQISAVDFRTGRIYIEQGKGSKDRYVIFPEAFGLTLKAYVQGDHGTRDTDRPLFESKQKRAYSTRRIQQIVTEYAQAAGLERVHPHLLRHQCFTHLTRSGLTDAQIQLVSGHSSKASLEVYQHLSLVDMKDDYEAAMRKAII